MLQEAGLYDSSRRMETGADGTALPVTDVTALTGLLPADANIVKARFSFRGLDFRLSPRVLPRSKMAAAKSDYEVLLATLRAQTFWREELSRDVPRHWERHGDLVLLPHGAFTSPLWRECGECIIMYCNM